MVQMETKGTMLTIAPKKLPKNSVKRTLGSKCKKKESPDADKSTLHAIAPKKRPQAVPRKGPGQSSASRRQSPPPGNNERHPIVRKRQYIIQDCQYPAAFDIPLQMLDQTFLEPVGDTFAGGIKEYRVCPLVIPAKSNQNWYCPTSKVPLFPGNAIYGKLLNEGLIRIVSIQDNRKSRS